MYQDDQIQRRVLYFRYIISLVFIVIFLGFWYLQVLKGDYYKELSENNRFMTKILTPPRGLVLDRSGKKLISNRLAYNLSLIRERVTEGV